MLIFKVDRKNEKIYLDAINRHPEAAYRAVSRGMETAGRGVFAEAFRWLSGPRAATGGFPVPVKTGHLRRLLAWLKPGESKSEGGDTVSAGELETVVYNSAAYADAIAKGLGSSAKFGPRDYLAKGLEDFNRGDGIAGAINDELAKEWT